MATQTNQVSFDYDTRAVEYYGCPDCVITSGPSQNQQHQDGSLISDIQSNITLPDMSLSIRQRTKHCETQPLPTETMPDINTPPIHSRIKHLLKAIVVVIYCPFKLVQGD